MSCRKKNQTNPTKPKPTNKQKKPQQEKKSEIAAPGFAYSQAVDS